MSRAIVVEGLARDFGGTRALDGVNLSVPTGQVLGLLGPNGAGKTTVVRTLATLLVPTAGRAWVGGFDVVREAARVREIIGLTGQYASVDEKLTGRENLILIGRLLGLKRAEAKARAPRAWTAHQRTVRGGTSPVRWRPRSAVLPGRLALIRSLPDQAS